MSIERREHEVMCSRSKADKSIREGSIQISRLGRISSGGPEYLLALSKSASTMGRRLYSRSTAAGWYVGRTLKSLDNEGFVELAAAPRMFLIPVEPRRAQAAAIETQLLSESDVTDPGEVRRMLVLLIPILYYQHYLSPENILELLPSFKPAVD